MSTTQMTGGQALVAQLVQEGVTHVFGLPGDQTMHALDAFYDEASIRFVTTRHEQGTTYLADGYARASGRPGVAFVVPGVGVYNAGAGLATACASAPIPKRSHAPPTCSSAPNDRSCGSVAVSCWATQPPSWRSWPSSCRP